MVKYMENNLWGPSQVTRIFFTAPAVGSVSAFRAVVAANGGVAMSTASNTPAQFVGIATNDAVDGGSVYVLQYGPSPDNSLRLTPSQTVYLSDKGFLNTSRDGIPVGYTTKDGMLSLLPSVFSAGSGGGGAGSKTNGPHPYLVANK